MMVFDVIILSFVLLFLLVFLLSFTKKVRQALKEKEDALKIARAVLILFAGTLLFYGSSFEGRLNPYEIFEAFYSSSKLFLVDGTFPFDQIRPHTPLIIRHLYFSLYYVVAFVAASVSAYTVLSFFRSFSYNLKFRFYAKRRNLCIFNELNSRSLYAAKSLLEEKITEGVNSDYGFFSLCSLKKTEPLIVFCDVFKQNTEASHELMTKAEEIGAICFRKNVVEVHKQLRRMKAYRRSRKRLLRYYLFGMNVKENVHHAMDLVKEETNSHLAPEQQFENLGIFALAFGDANGIRLESLNRIPAKKGKKNGYFVRRLDPALMMAHHILFNEDNVLVDSNNPEKELNVLVLGMGRYGFEIAKNITWFYQRNEGGINVHIIDRDPNMKSYVASLCPELVPCDFEKNASEPSPFRFVFHDPCDVFSTEFQNILSSEKMNGLNAVFIALGDDSLNAEAAIYMRRWLDRIHFLKSRTSELSENKTVPSYAEVSDDGKIKDSIKIFAVVHNDENALLVDENALFSAGLYNVSFVGMDSKIYTAKNIYDFEVESNSAENYHKSQKRNRVESPAEAVNGYNADEAARIFSIAEDCHKRFILEPLYGCDEKNDLSLCEQAKKNFKNAFYSSQGHFVFSDVDDALFQKNRSSPLKERGKYFLIGKADSEKSL